MKQSLLLLLIVVSSCNISNRSYSDAAKWMPSDFNPSKSTLLVEHYPGKEKWNTSMKNFLDKKYPGKYEIVNKEDILAINGKYTDIKVYKYAVLWAVIGSSSHTSFSGGSTTTNFSSPKIDYSGDFLDRASGKEYPVTKKYNNYGWQGFVPFFNSVIRQSK